MTLLVGYKEIGKVLNLSKQTLRRWQKKHGLPIKFIGTKPTIDQDVLKKWWEDFKQKPPEGAPGL
jgi:excisionase family DNA binding protein